MVVRAAMVRVVFVCITLLNEAASLSSNIRFKDGAIGASDINIDGDVARELSDEEIMSSMTLDKAYSLFMNMNQSSLDHALVAMIGAKVGKHKADTDKSDKLELDKARDMLNEMLNTVQKQMELDSNRCFEYDTNQLKSVKSLEHDITYANSEASAAKSEVMRASEVIQIISEVQLPKNRAELAANKMQCGLDAASLRAQLSIVKSDISVMRQVLNMICVEESLALLQTDADDGSLVKCVSCKTGRQMAFFKHSRIQPLLSSLSSQTSKLYVEQNLLDEFGDLERHSRTAVASIQIGGNNTPPDTGFSSDYIETPPATANAACNEALIDGNSSTYRGCQDKTLTGKPCQKWSAQTPHQPEYTEDDFPNAGLGDHNYCRDPGAEGTIWCYVDVKGNKTWESCEPLLDLKAPTGITQHECKEAPSCKLAKPNCNRLEDRFLVALAGIIDTKSDLSDQLDAVEDDCQKTDENFESLISSLESQLKEEQTNLATATKALQENQQLSETTGAQHKEEARDYHAEMKKCCDTRNGFKSDACALRKMRGELYRMEGVEAYITDCEVSAWIDEECSVSCGGGTQDRIRAILINPDNGSECPPLTMVRSCNAEGCPVNCEVGEWTEWSDCTAECGGGVKSRFRPKTVEPENGGDPCPEQSDAQECNNQACSADCVLSDWDSWSLCSKACDTGHRQRRKRVLEEQRGQGECAEEDDETRLGHDECNKFDCTELIPPPRDTLQCASMIDLIILLDGSGSLGAYGWKQSKKMTKAIIKQMVGGEQKVNMGLLLFSGPRRTNFDACTGQGESQAPTPSLEECQMFWISRLTGDTEAVLEMAKLMEWPQMTTLTSLALAEAGNELLRGRTGASSVVVVITDGKPMSPIKTGKTSEDLKQAARLIYIPVGSGVKGAIPKMKLWASRPWQDNVITIDYFSQLTSPSTLNTMISGFCPIVQ